MEDYLPEYVNKSSEILENKEAIYKEEIKNLEIKISKYNDEIQKSNDEKRKLFLQEEIEKLRRKITYYKNKIKEIK